MPRRRNTAVKAVAAGVVTVMVGLTLATVLPTTSTEPSSVTTTTVVLGPVGQELVRLLDQRDAATYHARYEAAAADAELVIETWQAPPRLRQDSEVRSAGQVVRARVLATPRGRLRCSQPDGGAWTCGPAAAGDSLDPVDAFRRRLGQGKLTARDTTLGGRAARCFELRSGQDDSELCVLPESGIPVLLRSGQTQLRLILLNEQVAGDLFGAPAPATAG